MRYGVLGPLELTADDGQPVTISSARQRALLGILLVHANELVSRDRLIEELWGDAAPARASKGLDVLVSRLRKALGPAGMRLQTRTPGYVLKVDPAELDAERYERLYREGREALQADDAQRAADALREAESLRRGPPLSDFVYEPFAQAAIARLAELAASIREERVEAELRLGQHERVVVDLEGLVREYPLRERPRRQLMLALYRSGRQADALAAYQSARQTLVAELGLEPSAALRELQERILRQDPGLAAPRETVKPPPVVAPPRPPAACPAVRTPPPHISRARLPKPASALIGRGRELDELHNLLAEPALRLVTLTGPGGSGKTRLALELAWRVAEKFRDGAVFAELGPVRDAQLVPATIAAALGLASDAHTWERLGDHLHEKETLLVVDNYEHLLDAAPPMAELLRAASGLRVIATSRAPLGLSDEREYLVDPLLVPRPERLPDLESLEDYDAAAFLLARARPHFVASDDTAPAVAEICICLDGLPLALELAAPRLRTLPPHKLLERLERRLDLVGGARDVPDRQRTLRATIDWSHELLAGREQQLFPRLAIFRGGFTVAAVEAVMDWPDPIDVEDSLRALAEWNLVVALPAAPSGPRFRMLETIREYGLERLSRSGAEEEARCRHAGFFLELAERAEPELRGAEQATWTQALGQDTDNLREALAWFHQRRDVTRGFRLLSALWRFWQIRGLLAEGREHAERLLAIDSGEADPAARARAVACAGRLAFFQGDYPTARQYLDRAFTLQRDVGDAAEIALLLGNLGMLAAAQGRTDEARSLIRSSADAFRAIPDPWGEANSLAYLGQLEHNAGDPDGARELLHRSLDLAAEAGEKRMAAFSLTQLGAIAREAGQDGIAERLFEQALTVQRELGDIWSIASSSTNLAALALRQGAYGRAAALLQESLRLQWEGCNRPGIAACLERLGELALERDDAERAIRLIAASQALYAAIGATPDAAETASHERAAERLVQHFGDTGFSTRWAAGATLKPAEAVALATDRT